MDRAAVDARIRELNNARRRNDDDDDAAGHQQPVSISTAYFFDHYATPEDVAVTVTEADFLAARDELVPSVSAGELAHYEKVRAAFEGGRDKEAGGAAAAPANATRKPLITSSKNNNIECSLHTSLRNFNTRYLVKADHYSLE